MASPFIGEIKLIPYNFAPVGWAFCDGSLLSIAENEALFALIGTIYGGNGQTTFGLPDLRGRVPMHQSGQNPIGAVFGSESVTLTTGQMPMHGHQLHVLSGNGTILSPIGKYIGGSKTLGKVFGDGSDAAMGPSGFAGGNQPHDNMQPFLVLNFVIATEGVFPPQN